MQTSDNSHPIRPAKTAYSRFLTTLLAVPLAILLAATGSLTLTGCSGTTTQTAGDSYRPDTLRLGVVSQVGMALPLARVALDKGLQELVPNMVVRRASSPTELRTNFLSGRYDIATMPTNVAATILRRGGDIVMLGAMDLRMVYLLGTHGPQTWSELVGAHVHIPFKGDALELTFRRLARAKGVESGMHYTFYPAPMALPMGFGTGDISYAVLPEHLATVVENSYDGVHSDITVTRLVDVAEDWKATFHQQIFPVGAIVMRGELVRQQPELVARLLQVLQGTTGVVSEELAREVAEISDVPVDMVRRVVPGMEPRFLSTVRGMSVGAGDGASVGAGANSTQGVGAGAVLSSAAARREVIRFLELVGEVDREAIGGHSPDADFRARFFPTVKQ